MAPGFGADAAELLAMDGAVSADVTAFVANDAARLPGPAGSAIVVDDFHIAAAAVVWVSAAVSGGRSCAGCRHGCNVSALRGLRSGMARGFGVASWDEPSCLPEHEAWWWRRLGAEQAEDGRLLHCVVAR